MNLNELHLAILPILFTCIAFVLLFMLGHRYIVSGYGAYEKKFVSSVSTTLQDAFIFYDPRHIFRLTLAAAALGAIFGFLSFGLFGALATTVIVALLPQPILRFLRKRRLKSFIYQMPDCLSAMATSLRAGMNLSRVFELASRTQPKPMSQELSLVMSEQRMGRRLEDSLLDLHRRIPTQEVELLRSAVTISRLVGGNLANALDTLAETLREKALVEGKIDALTSQGRMQARIAILLPVLVGLALHSQEPEAMRVLYTEWVGWITLTIISAMMVLAYVIIRKIVNIEV